MVAAWRSELGRIIHVFEVRSTVQSLLILLTVYLQTELAIHTHIAVTDIREDVGDIRGGVVDIRHLEKPSRLSDTIGSYFHLSGIIHQVSRHLSVIAPFDGFSASAASIGHSQSPYETTCTTCPAILCLPVLDRSFFLSVGVPRHVCFPSSHHRPSA